MAATLTSKQKAHLQALAHDKKPIILLGKNGVTDAVVKETRAALLKHELIKARMQDGAADYDVNTLVTGAAAELVAQLGRVVILYKQHPDKPTIRFPKGKKRGLFDVVDE
jgi:RNA-binding protein